MSYQTQQPIQIVITRGGNLLEIAGPDGRAPHPFVRRVVEDNFRYTRATYQRGRDAIDPVTQEHRPVATDVVSLWYADDVGRINLGLGFQYRLANLAHLFRWETRWVDVPPPEGLRPDRYLQDWEGMLRALTRSGLGFRHRQEECLRTVADWPHSQIMAAPAFGKTFLFRLFAKLYPRARIGIITPGKDTLRGTLQDLRSFLTPLGEFVGAVYGGREEWQRVTVISADSMHRIEYDDVTSPKFLDTVFVDEAHAAPTRSRAPWIARLQWAMMIALSGTLHNRADNAHEELEQVFGPVRFVCTNKELHQAGSTVPARVHWLPMTRPAGLGAGLRDTQLAQAAVWYNGYRNARFASYLSSFDQAENQIMVMVRSVDHAAMFKKFAPWFTMVYGSNCVDEDRWRRLVDQGLIDPDRDPLVTPKLRDQYRERFRARDILQVVCTPIWSTGVNFEDLQILARADAMRSDIDTGQVPQRAIRLGKTVKKEHAIIVDSRDEFNKALEKRADHRKSKYTANGWRNIVVAPGKIPRHRLQDEVEAETRQAEELIRIEQDQALADALAGMGGAPALPGGGP